MSTDTETVTIRVVANQLHGPAFVRLLSETDRMPESLWLILLQVGPPCIVPVNDAGGEHACDKPADGFLVRCCTDIHLRYSPICDHHQRDLEVWLEAGQTLECEDCGRPAASGFVLPEAADYT